MSTSGREIQETESLPHHVPRTPASAPPTVTNTFPNPYRLTTSPPMAIPNINGAAPESLPLMGLTLEDQAFPYRAVASALYGPKGYNHAAITAPV